MQTLYCHKKSDDLPLIMDVFERSSLKYIIQKAKLILALDRTLQTILPAEFAPHCQVMTINNNRLVVGVSSAAIAMRIRFMSGDLLSELQKQTEFSYVKFIDCRVTVANKR